jgi:hypothetical protein
VAEVVHISSPAVKVGPEIRQRCVWCGESLIEVDLRFIAVEAEQADKPYPTWPVDAFIGKDGGATYVVQPTPDNKVPRTFCGAPSDLSTLTTEQGESDV